ncbi:MAG TPA: DUF2092 domain-containing protein [Planctomycetaceae bacterium]|jgi:hypothetical protein|nr:DUF2092 domain-containing protein [Planctomycetaceae bacterium]
MTYRLSLMSRARVWKLIPVVSLSLACAAWACPVRAEDKKKEDKLDPKAVEICKKAGDLYKHAKTFHADGALDAKIDAGGQQIDINATLVFDFERSNQVAIKVRVKSDAEEGLDLISDGKKLTTYRRKIHQYVQDDAPKEVGGLGLAVLKLGVRSPGILLPNVLHADPGASLLDGVNSCSYVGIDKVDGTPAHHLKFSQEQFDWEMWVAADGKPLILQMTRSADVPGGKLNTRETYKNWTIDAPAAKDAFVFSPPKGTTKMDDFTDAN